MPEWRPGIPSSASRRRRSGAGRLARLLTWWRSWLLTPNLLPLASVLALSTVGAAWVMVAFGDIPLAGPGQIADRTRTVRIDFTIADNEATQRDREDARRRTPRLYNADETVLAEIESSLTSLPTALQAVESLDQVASEIVEQFRLDAARFEAIRSLAATEESASAWSSRVSRFVRSLSRVPILSAEEFGLATQSTSPQIVTVLQTGTREEVPTAEALPLGAPDAAERLARRAGSNLVGLERNVAVQRVLSLDQPTFTFDREATETLRADRAAAVPSVQATYRVGQPIYIAGEVVSTEQVILAKQESDRFAAEMTFPQTLSRWIAAFAAAAMLTALLAGYIRTYYGKTAQNPLSAAALAALIVLGAAAACWGVSGAPALLWFIAVGPIVLVAMVIATAFDRRLAVMVASTLAVLAGIALKMPVGFFLVALVAAVTSAWQLAGVRHRSDVLRGGLIASLAIALTTFAVMLVSRDISPLAISASMFDAVWAGLAGLLAAALTLALLPIVERIFDVTTGMTLSELRDSSHPLLRELQQRAPGTFNHSHTVAIIAEAAAEAIGADGMHVYVGAMYHDIGKMHKAEYFVENQSSAQRTVHERLSPAMSLLVIVAHVKDGLELARDTGLPRPLHHYIESHHGTTLVQYFFHRAKQIAEEEGDTNEGPSEVEYRYPGPKPRTKEAAILMIADSVEAATRAMAEPTPSRIGSLVREIARKYLKDGQFDDAAITLKELSAVEESITKSLCSIYHSRIAYPSASGTRGAKSTDNDNADADATANQPQTSTAG